MYKITKLLFIISLLCGLCISSAFASRLLIPMDLAQSNHLRAYGLAYWVLLPQQAQSAEWLLNYRGGSFLLDDTAANRAKALELGVLYEGIGDSQLREMRAVIEKGNMKSVKLEKAPKIAVYHPPQKGPWDDAVILVLNYAEIPYTLVYDKEVLEGQLLKYDWLHLHHEDFTGQYGKFYGLYRFADWYAAQVAAYETAARNAGFKTVAAHKLAVCRTIKNYVEKGGFLFGVCSVPDSVDVALAADGLDIIPPEIDGTPMDSGAESKLNFGKTFAFQNFTLESNPFAYEIANIDVMGSRGQDDYFSLFDFSAKQDPVPTMLVQNHVDKVREFLGQCTSFRKELLKPHVLILGETEKQKNEKTEKRVKYIHGNLGSGTFTFLGGHDPEDYAHIVGEKDTDLSYYPNSPGYRLILNNILFPAVKKEEKKT